MTFLFLMLECLSCPLPFAAIPEEHTDHIVWMKLGLQDCLHSNAAYTRTGLSRNYGEKKSEIKMTGKTDGRSSLELEVVLTNAISIKMQAA